MKTLLIPTTLAIALGSAGPWPFAADKPAGRPTASLRAKIECQNVEGGE